MEIWTRMSKIAADETSYVQYVGSLRDQLRQQQEFYEKKNTKNIYIYCTKVCDSEIKNVHAEFMGMRLPVEDIEPAISAVRKRSNTKLRDGTHSCINFKGTEGYKHAMQEFEENFEAEVKTFDNLNTEVS